MPSVKLSYHTKNTEANTTFRIPLSVLLFYNKHRDIAPSFLPRAAEALRAAGVRLRGTKEVMDLINSEADDIMDEQDFATGYLDLIASVKLVSDVNEAVAHINWFGSHHTDAIITENDETAAVFMQMVDSAGVSCLCSPIHA